jgi:uncharacterized membrane protein YgdD (TMEM256/DUF423 family)
MKRLIQLASLLAATAVIIGAFGAHALKPMLSQVQLQSYETGVKYHLVHSLGVLVIAILYHQFKIKLFYQAGIVMCLGIVLFSFSIYLLSLREVMGISSWTFLGPITPIGGLLMISGWILVFIAATKIKNV